MQIDQKQYVDDGYFITSFNHLDALEKIKALCIEACQAASKGFSNLGEYHKLGLSDAEHDELQFQLFNRINEAALHKQFVNDNLNFFTQLVGPDLDIQSFTYLRISRPGQQKDNIGLHRDTEYGNTAYEISLSLPLIDQPQGAGLRIVPGSHMWQDYQSVQVKRPDVDKGTDKNLMGFLYAPKIPQNIKSEQILNTALKFGQGLGFTLGLVHGQEENTSGLTRWSIDFRFKNAWHPMDPNLKQGYYASFSRGCLTELGQNYYHLNGQDLERLVSTTAPST